MKVASESLTERASKEQVGGHLLPSSIAENTFAIISFQIEFLAFKDIMFIQCPSIATK
jgi:hypothetical protein